MRINTIVNRGKVRTLRIEKKEYQVIGRDVRKNTIKLSDVETGETFHTHVPIIGAAIYFKFGTILTLSQFGLNRGTELFIKTPKVLWK